MTGLPLLEVAPMGFQFRHHAFRRRAAETGYGVFTHQSGPPPLELAAEVFLGDELGTQGAPSVQI